MANTITQTTLVGGGDSKTVVRHIHIISDGSEETDLVIYDNSTLVANVNKGSLIRVKATGSACLCRLEWDQTADFQVISFDPSQGVDLDFSCFGGIRNPGGTGATGDLVLTTANLDAGDEVTIIIEINQL